MTPRKPRNYFCRTRLQLGIILSAIASFDSSTRTIGFTPYPSPWRDPSPRCLQRPLIGPQNARRQFAINLEREEITQSTRSHRSETDGARIRNCDPCLSSTTETRHRRRRRPSASTVLYFETRFEELLEFRQIHGHTRVPRREGRLGDWVNKLRQRRDRLDDVQINRLNEIGFCWDASGDRRRKEVNQWWKQFEYLRETAVGATENQAYTLQKTPTLSFALLSKSQKSWLMRQRLEYINHGNGPSKKLSEDQIQALDELDRNWWKTARERKWDEQYSALKQFKLQYGHCDVTTSHDDKTLFHWVQNTRKKYRSIKLGRGDRFRADGSLVLSKRQIELLDRIAFNWDPWGHHSDF